MARRIWLAPLCLAFTPLGAAAQTAAMTPGMDLVKMGAPDPTDLRSVMPVGDPNNWLTKDDFAILAGARPYPNGQFDVTLAITPDDRVSDCRVDWYDRVDISARLCPILIKRGRFIHGLAEDGSKHGGILKMLLSYMLVPAGHHFGGAPVPPAPAGWRPYKRIAAPTNPADLTIASLTPVLPPILYVKVSADGKLLWCRIYKTSGLDAVDVRACQQAGKISLAPALGADGKPAEMTTLFKPSLENTAPASGSPAPSAMRSESSK